MHRAAFLDRDGVINIDHGYLYRWEDFEYVPGAVEAMRALHQAGYLLVIVTNQSGIARGMYTEQDFQTLSERMREHLLSEGVPLAAIEFCPHLPDGQVPAYRCECGCRKPAPGMILRAARSLDVCLAQSLLFGDKPSDIEAAYAANLGQAVILAKNGEGPIADLPSQWPALRHQSLHAAVKALLPA